MVNTDPSAATARKHLLPLGHYPRYCKYLWGDDVADLTRRFMLKATGAFGASMLSAGSGVAAAAGRGRDASSAGAAPPAPSASSITYLFLNREEAAFIESAVSRLIPADAKWPGALELGVSNFIDKQLTGAWGMAG
jgi:gluconate 2-dehydrogenase gamma chain